MAFHKPVIYLMTRLEGITEMALFLSWGIIALLLRRKYLNTNVFDLSDNANAVFVLALATLLLMLLAGAYRTGELARPGLFFYPYFVIMLRRVEEPTLHYALWITGFQTLYLQTTREYLW